MQLCRHRGLKHAREGCGAEDARPKAAVQRANANVTLVDAPQIAIITMRYQAWLSSQGIPNFAIFNEWGGAVIALPPGSRPLVHEVNRRRPWSLTADIRSTTAEELSVRDAGSARAFDFVFARAVNSPEADRLGTDARFVTTEQFARLVAEHLRTAEGRDAGSRGAADIAGH